MNMKIALNLSSIKKGIMGGVALLLAGAVQGTEPDSTNLLYYRPGSYGARRYAVCLYWA